MLRTPRIPAWLVGTFLTGVALFSSAAPANVPESGVHDQARELALAEDHAGVVELLSAHLKRTAADPVAHDLIGVSLLALEREDEAAHHLDTARELYRKAGQTKTGDKLKKHIKKADSLSTRRDALFAGLGKNLLRAGEKLFENGQPERALALFERIAPIAGPKELPKISEWIEKIRSSGEEVDLDDAGGVEKEGDAFALFEYESKHYRIVANLEPDVATLVGDTMDDIFGSYVQIYFDGDERKVTARKATIRIHPDKPRMLEEYGGTGAGPEGWWSPGDNRVVTFDTRTKYSTLDEMLDTLFHEASHQFMTMLARGSGTPSWLNEGTASFFEGAIAMADGTVLWPEAASGRLRNLNTMTRGRGPTVREVITFPGPGSYPGEMYAFGWGLVYFMQQWENPETLEYEYRPLYSEYRDKIISRGGNSLKTFEEIFLGKNSPLGHETLDDFVKDWEEWIEDTIYPLNFGNAIDIRALRWELVERYMAAADASKDDKKAKISEEEFLLRALGNVEYMRTRMDGERIPSLGILLQQADILERLERPRTAAPILEQLLDLADDGHIEVDEETYKTVERRLQKLDKGNYALRNARSRERSALKSAKKLLADYAKGDAPLVLRAYTFAATAGKALADEELLAEADRLRGEAREAGLLLGRIEPFHAPRKAWKSVFSEGPRKFEVAGDRVTMGAVRPNGMLNTALVVDGEYEVRARLVRDAERRMGTAHGIVIAGTLQGDWAVVGIEADGNLAVWTVRFSGSGARTRRTETINLDEPIVPGTDVDVRIHMRRSGRVTIEVEGQPVKETQLPIEPPAERFVGVFVRDGEMTVKDGVVELYP